MKKIKNKIDGFFRSNREAMSSHAGKIGGYSFALSVIVLGILIAVNVIVNQLPSNLTQYDISAAQLYSLTSSTKVVAGNLESKVTIYWITQSGEEDEKIERLLNVYDSLSDKIKVVKKNPDVYPTFAKQYTDEDVSNNSLIVVSGDRNKYIAYEDIYETDYSEYYTTGQTSSSFDGEGQITAAINYVVTDDLPKIYYLTGHGEADISDSFQKALDKQNIETSDFSLLNTDTIPDDCDAILINAPTSDISDKEAEKLEDYLTSGGKLIVLSGPVEDDTKLTNLDSLLTDYGIKAEDGIVIEGDTDHYAFNMPYLLLTEINSSDITDPLLDEDDNVLVPIARAFDTTNANADVTVTDLLSSTDSSFSKLAGYSLTTYDKEDGDIDGPFSIAFSVEDSTADSKIIWVGSSSMLDDTYDSYSSGANTDFIMNSISWLVGEDDSISIRSKSMDYNYLSISETQSMIIKICLIGIIPIAYLLFGVDEVLRRKKRNK